MQSLNKLVLGILFFIVITHLSNFSELIIGYSYLKDGTFFITLVILFFNILS